jgi:hypothetical protein
MSRVESWRGGSGLRFQLVGAELVIHGADLGIAGQWSSGVIAYRGVTTVVSDLPAGHGLARSAGSQRTIEKCRDPRAAPRGCRVTDDRSSGFNPSGVASHHRSKLAVTRQGSPRRHSLISLATLMLLTSLRDSLATGVDNGHRVGPRVCDVGVVSVRGERHALGCIFYSDGVSDNIVRGIDHGDGVGRRVCDVDVASVRSDCYPPLPPIAVLADLHTQGNPRLDRCPGLTGANMTSAPYFSRPVGHHDVQYGQRIA